TSACRTHVRTVSRLMPSWSATRAIAPTFCPDRSRISNTSRIARAFSSSGYFFGAATAAHPPKHGSLHRTRGASHAHHETRIEPPSTPATLAARQRRPRRARGDTQRYEYDYFGDQKGQAVLQTVRSPPCKAPVTGAYVVMSITAYTRPNVIRPCAG